MAATGETDDAQPGDISIAPPVGQIEREGWNSHRGYVYQVWFSIRQWLVLAPNEVLFLEYADDTARTSTNAIDVAQVRHVAASISLNTDKARAALGNFWAHVIANADRVVSFQYVTTGEIAYEQGNDFDTSEPGIILWEKAKTDIGAAAKIHEYLKSKATQLTREMSAFLASANTQSVQERLIRPFTWHPKSSTLNQLEADVENRIYDFGVTMGLRLAQDQILAVKRALFTFATEAATTETLRKLSQRQLTDLIVDATSRRVPLTEPLIPEVGRISRSPKTLPVIDWITPSQALENWPKTLGDGHEIVRPELAVIEKKIVETEKSAHLLLGEPGSGKSALMAKLSASLSAQGIKHLSIKADLIPKDIKSLDDLVEGMEGSTLTEAVRDIAAKEKFVVLIDQLDAVCSLIDRHTDRLNMLVAFLQRLGRLQKIHIVTSCRPFEFTTDSRLQDLHTDRITLTLPPWDAISGLVLGENTQVVSVADLAKEVLRNPWHLKLFLDLPNPKPVLTTFYNLVNHIWNQRVLRPGAPSRCSQLVDLVANRINDSEEFWIPDAMADAFPDEKIYLLAEGILKQTDDLRFIGFRHQTFYDYFLLRTFLHKGTSLIDYIKGRDQSFFIRPTIVRALAFLRDSSRTEYTRTIADMLGGGYLRPHLYLLLLEFMGQQPDPLPEEIHYMLPLLKDDIHGQRVLRVVTGSPGWFKAVLTTDFEERWVRSGFPNVVHTYSFLSAAVAFDETAVVDLIARNWLAKPDHDRIAFNILSGAKVCGPQLIDCIMVYANRRNLDEMSWLLRPLLKSEPSKACEIVGTVLRREAAEFAAGNPQVAAQLTVRRTPRRRSNEDSVQGRIRELLHGENSTHLGLCNLAESRPAVFLEHTWRPIREMLILTGMGQENTNPANFSHDFVDLDNLRHGDPSDDLLLATEKALQGLAWADPQALLRWIEGEKASDLLTIHRLIARGMLSLPVSYANSVIKYLLADRRRLSLGSLNDDVSDTKALLEKFSPKCARGLLFKITHQIELMPRADILSWKRHNGEISSWSVARWSRSERHQLLACMPLRIFGRRMKTLMRCERKFFGGHIPSRHSLRGQSGFVGAPVSLEEMEAMSDDAITGLFDLYNDLVDRNQALRRIDIARSGGVLQQSEVFGFFAAAHPDRARLQIPLLRPGKHEHYAARLIEKLADPRPTNSNADIALFPAVVEATEIEALIREFDARGFVSPSFRESAARTLQHICRTQPGLTAATIQMLLGWLSQVTEQIRDPEEPQNPETSILFSGHTMWSCPQGKSTVAEAIIDGLLARVPPATDECLAFVKTLYHTDKEYLLWSSVMYKLPYLFGVHSEQLTVLFTKLYKEFPALFSLIPTAVAWSCVSGWTTPVDAEREWFELLLKHPQPYYRQLAGELIFIHCARSGTVWSKDLVERGIKEEFGDYFFRGLAFAAATCVAVPSFNQLVESILTPALSSTKELINRAAMTFTYHITKDGWSETCRKLVLQFIEGDMSQTHSPEILCHKLEGIVEKDPETCLTVCELFVAKYKTRLADIATSLPFAADHIINIALTTQRFLPFRERGLALFEILLEMNVTEAKKAADLLNERRPLSV